jgi:Tfp pilus assembly protein PilV
MKSRRHGLSLVEVAISTLLVGVVLVAALRTVGSATVSQFANGQRAQALLIANELANEILDREYSDPTASGIMGYEAGENIAGSRAAFDDVDDYHNWSATPPVREIGSTLPASQNWTETVLVDYVQPDDLDAVSVTDQGIKRVRINITQGTTTLATLIFCVTDNSNRNRISD